MKQVIHVLQNSVKSVGDSFICILFRNVEKKPATNTNWYGSLYYSVSFIAFHRDATRTLDRQPSEAISIKEIKLINTNQRKSAFSICEIKDAQ